jgi:hypothetical protein
VDTRLGLQLDGKFTDRLSAVVQVIAEDQQLNSWTDEPNPSFRPVVEWAYGYMTYVGSDGADITYSTRFGGITNTVNAHAGKQRSSLSSGALHPEIWGVNDTVQAGDLTMRVSYAHMKVDFQELGAGQPLADFEAVMNSLPFSMGADAAAASAGIRESHFDNASIIHNYTLGATYDPGKWFALAEIYAIRTGGFLPNSTAGYVSAGVRWKKFTPYATISRLSMEQRSFSIPSSRLPPGLDAYAAGMNGYANALLGSNYSQTTTAAGVRWDFMNNFDAKFQFEHIDLSKDSTGLYRLQSQQAGFETGSSANVVSLAVDFVF